MGREDGRGAGKQKAKPRRRSHRPLRNLENDPMAPQTPLPTPEWDGEGWAIPPSLASRFHQKSALGKIVSGGNLRLNAVEVMFCHWHRHLPLPSDNWIETQLGENPHFIHEAVILEAIRDSGEKIVLNCNLFEQHNTKLVNGSWGMHWVRDKHPSRDQPAGQVRWARTNEKVDWNELCKWAIEVKKAGQIPEFLVIDGEFEVTTYEINLAQPRGKLPIPSSLSSEDWKGITESLKSATPTNNGIFISKDNNWPLETIGIQQMGGRWLYPEEVNLLKSITESKTPSNIGGLLHELLERGLLVRPGFKYGCRWRIYEEEMSGNHAPWLLSPILEAAETWEGACLASRLASAVHKTWICAIPNPESANERQEKTAVKDEHVFLSLERMIFGK